MNRVPQTYRQGVEALLHQVGDVKHGKERVHVDLRTADLAAEVSRNRGLSACLLTGRSDVEDGWRWHVLADPTATSSASCNPGRHRGASSQRTMCGRSGCCADLLLSGTGWES
jgi:hypothetical protein